MASDHFYTQSYDSLIDQLRKQALQRADPLPRLRDVRRRETRRRFDPLQLKDQAIYRREAGCQFFPCCADSKVRRVAMALHTGTKPPGILNSARFG